MDASPATAALGNPVSPQGTCSRGQLDGYQGPGWRWAEVPSRVPMSSSSGRCPSGWPCRSSLSRGQYSPSTPTAKHRVGADGEERTERRVIPRFLHSKPIPVGWSRTLLPRPGDQVLGGKQGQALLKRGHHAPTPGCVPWGRPCTRSPLTHAGALGSTDTAGGGSSPDATPYSSHEGGVQAPRAALGSHPNLQVGGRPTQQNRGHGGSRSPREAPPLPPDLVRAASLGLHCQLRTTGNAHPARSAPGPH